MGARQIFTYFKLLLCLPAILVLFDQINQARMHQFRIVHLLNQFAKCRYNTGRMRLKSLVFWQFVNRDVLKWLKLLLIFGILFEKTIKNDFKLCTVFLKNSLSMFFITRFFITKVILDYNLKMRLYRVS